MLRAPLVSSALLCALLASLAQYGDAKTPENPTDSSGSVLLASAEGLSVFRRDGSMEFGYFPTVPKDGKPLTPAWGDMIYDAHRLPTGNYLCSSHHFVRELSRDGTLVWEYRVQAPVELKTCCPLPDGGVMTLDAERMEMVQLSDRGHRVSRRIPVPTLKSAAPHYRYNLLRRTSHGTFLIALRAEKAFIEVDEDGKELWRQTVPDLPVVAERLPDGNTLMSWRGGLLEANPSHEVVWQLTAADLKDFPVVLFGGFHRFSNGNTLVANSDWHYRNPEENRVQLFEVTPEKRVVWTLESSAFSGKKPGSLEPRTGLVEHRIIGLHWLGAPPSTAP